MEPHIRYCTTTDGVSIAYMDLGEGEPLIYSSNALGDVHWYQHNDPTREQVDYLVAAGCRVVRYDMRGMGSSDRHVSDLSLDAESEIWKPSSARSASSASRYAGIPMGVPSR